MIKYTELEPGKKYELGGINVGKFISRNGNFLIFKNSEFGERTENEIDAYEEDDFIEIKRKKSATPKSIKRKIKRGERKGGKKRITKKHKGRVIREKNSYN